MRNYKLNKYEQEILDAFEAGKLKPAKNQAKKIKELKLTANDFLNKTKNINIRISNGDLQKIKAKAVEKGLPYQTLIGSLLHQHFAETSEESIK